MTVFTCCTVVSATQGQSTTMALNYSAAAKTGASAPSIRPLSIGDQVPDIVFENVLNYKSKKARLSDFKGKLVILDMWSVYCTSCIAAFPKMEALQKEFGDKIQILLVNPHDPKYDSEEKIKTTLEKQKIRTGYYTALPIPIHDSILNQYFPHKAVPHEVWIDGNGQIIAITGSEEVTKENLMSVLEGKTIALPTKNETEFDSNVPLLIEGNGGGDNNFVYRSIFTSYNGSVPFIMGVRKNAKAEPTGVYIYNRPLYLMVKFAYSDIVNGLASNRIIIDSKQPGKFKTDFDAQYAYCYDLTMPPRTGISLVSSKTYLKEDLRRVFNIKAWKEKRKFKCLIVTAGAQLKKSITKYSQPDLDLGEGVIKQYIHNFSIKDVLGLLDRLTTPLLDETSLALQIDIDLPANINLSDSKAMIKALENAGFIIREEEREINMVVISDN